MPQVPHTPDRHTSSYRLILDALPLPVVLVEPSYRVNFINASARKVFGLDSPPQPFSISAHDLFGSSLSLSSERHSRLSADHHSSDSESGPWGDSRRVLTCYPVGQPSFSCLVSFSSFRSPVDYFSLPRSTASGHAFSPSLSDGGTASPPPIANPENLSTIVLLSPTDRTPATSTHVALPDVSVSSSLRTQLTNLHLPVSSKSPDGVSPSGSSSVVPSKDEHPLSSPSSDVLTPTATSNSPKNVANLAPPASSAPSSSPSSTSKSHTSLPPVSTAVPPVRSSSSPVAESESDRVRRFERILDNMPQIVFTTTPSGSYNYFNARWYDFTGLTPEQSLGLGWSNPFHVDDLPHSTRAWSHSLLTGEPFSTEYRCRRHDGTWRWMLGRALPFVEGDHITGWFGTCTDVDEFVAIRSKLAETEKQVTSLIDGADMTLISVNRDLKITHFQGPYRAFGGIHGHDTSLVGANFEAVLPDKNLRDAVDKVMNGSQKSVRLQLRPSDPQATWYRCMITPIIEREDNSVNRGISGAVIVALDISDVKEAERRLEASFKERSHLEASEAAAREASRLKSDWAKNISHEIRTPIAGMLGMAELLRDDPSLSPGHRTSVIKIIKAGKILLEMIGMVLDLGKIEAGKLELESRAFHLSDIITDAELFAHQARKKNLNYTQHLDVAYDGYVEGDLPRIRQVLANLIANAVKFTTKGYVKFSVSQVEESEGSVKIVFTVEDSGIGIDKETIPTLFKPFQQAEVSTSRKFGGTGLGLSISKTLVELMGGKIDLTSVLGRGTTTTFWIPFPKSKAVSDLSSPKATVEKPSADIPYEGIWILVAEDNDLNREILVKFLRRKNFNVESVTNGRDAVLKLKEQAFDLLMLDGHMPDLDGLEAARRIRSDSDPRIRSTKLIAVTASAMQGDRERFLEAGMDDYIAKPVRLDTLEHTVMKHVQARHTPVSTPDEGH